MPHERAASDGEIAQVGEKVLLIVVEADKAITAGADAGMCAYEPAGAARAPGHSPRTALKGLMNLFDALLSPARLLAFSEDNS